MKRLQITDNELVAALRHMAPETGALICMGCGYEHGCFVHGCAVLRAAADRLACLSAPLPNSPLTLEELREMDGEPVWIVSLDGVFEPQWRLVWVKNELLFERYGIFCGSFFNEKNYGKTWLAYRRKLEEETA